MTPAKVNASIHKIVDAYKAKLSQYDEEIFQVTPPINGWSYSEVYSHIFDASLLSLIALENCIKGKGEDQPTHFIVKVILFLGAFPPAQKYKVPKRMADRVKKITKAEALDFFGLDKSKKTVLILGGSLGARRINQLIEKELDFFQSKGFLV